MRMSAIISDCGIYRYRLVRDLTDGSCPLAVTLPMLFIMVNPSTADAKKDDATIRRCKGFAIREGATHLIVVNLFAFRERSPKKVKEAQKKGIDIVGPHNNEHIHTAIRDSMEMPVVLGWGSHDFLGDRGDHVRNYVIHLRGAAHCLGRTKKGFPRHPLFVEKIQPLEVY